MPVTITDMRAVAEVLGLKGTSKPDIATKVAEALKSKKSRDLAAGAVSALAKKAGIKERKSARSTWDAIVAADTAPGPLVHRLPTSTPATKTCRGAKSSKSSKSSKKAASSDEVPGSSFGGWWDNTHKTYCHGRQCANPKTLNRGAPFHVPVAELRKSLRNKNSLEGILKSKK